jgi:hypothetical protein
MNIATIEQLHAMSRPARDLVGDWKAAKFTFVSKDNGARVAMQFGGRVNDQAVADADRAQQDAADTLRTIILRAANEALPSLTAQDIGELFQ